MGDSYTLSRVFLETMARYGLAAGLLLLLVFVGVGVLAYFLKARIDIMRADAQNQAAEREREAAARERERQALLSELAGTRAQVHQFLSNHLDHLRQESEQHRSVLGDISRAVQEQAGACREIATDLRAHRDNSEKSMHDLEVKIASL